MSAPTSAPVSPPILVCTIDGQGFPNVYVYEYRGYHFGVAKTWRSSPAGWNVSDCDALGNWAYERDADAISIAPTYTMPQTRKAAIEYAVAEIDWHLRPVPTVTLTPVGVGSDHQEPLTLSDVKVVTS